MPRTKVESRKSKVESWREAEPTSKYTKSKSRKLRNRIALLCAGLTYPQPPRQLSRRQNTRLSLRMFADASKLWALSVWLGRPRRPMHHVCMYVCMSVYLLVCALRLLTMDRTTVTSLTHTGPQPTSSPRRLIYPTAIATHSAITAPSG